MAEVKFSEFPPETTLTASKVVGLDPTGENAQFDADAFKGDQGDKGDTGDQGDAATIDAGTTVTGAPGSNATVNNVGTTSDAIFDFSIPEGEAGVKGDIGDTGDKGDKGDQGDAGVAATVDAGATTTLPPGSAATVVNVGTTSAAEFEFGIPEGIQGPQGDAGEGYILQGDASVAEINLMDAATITTNFAWQMTDSGTIQPTGALQSTVVVAGDLVVWAASDYFINYGQATGSGDVIGPATAITDRIATYADNTGKLIKDSGLMSTAIVSGPPSSVSGRIATYNGTDGKTIADGGKLASDLVTGPPSATSANFPSFNGASGKIIADSGFSSGSFVASSFAPLITSALQPGDNLSELTNDEGFKRVDNGTILPADGTGYNNGDVFLVYTP